LVHVPLLTGSPAPVVSAGLVVVVSPGLVPVVSPGFVVVVSPLDVPVGRPLSRGPPGTGVSRLPGPDGPARLSDSAQAVSARTAIRAAVRRGRRMGALLRLHEGEPAMPASAPSTARLSA